MNVYLNMLLLGTTVPLPPLTLRLCFDLHAATLPTLPTDNSTNLTKIVCFFTLVVLVFVTFWNSFENSNCNSENIEIWISFIYYYYFICLLDWLIVNGVLLVLQCLQTWLRWPSKCGRWFRERKGTALKNNGQWRQNKLGNTEEATEIETSRRFEGNYITRHEPA